MEDVTFVPAVELAQRIRAGEVSAGDVVAAHLDRIEEANPGLNAVVQIAAAEARARAAAADDALRAGGDVGPLHGVPFTVKDWIETAGVECTGGFEERRGTVPERDATSVARLRAAGAILVGKTNVGHDNPMYGPTRNPYDRLRSAGFSSSGEAAIVAAGGSAFGLGSDSGGSIRQPAHCCGVAGMRPSTGRVPLTGHYPRINPMADPRTVIGPLARHVGDLALVLPVICGEDGVDPSAVPVPLASPADVDPSRLRVAFYADDGVAAPAPEMADSVRAVAAALAGMVREVEERRPPGLAESVEITRAYWARPESMSWEEWVPDGEARLTGEEVERSIFRWDRFRRAMLGFMADWDVILSPAAPGPAPLHPAPENGVSYLLPYSLTGWPSVVVPGGSSTSGLPIGVQIVAGPWRDHVALAAAGLVEGITGGWKRPPA